MAARALDVVVFGSTGFTGRLVAKHLATHYGAKSEQPVRFALAGRSQAKLEALAAELQLSGVPLIVADSENEPSLDAMCRQTRVVLSTVGPYALYGKKLAASVTRTATHYVDLTGEPHFMLDNVRLHDEAVRASKTCLVSACGYDSIPFDLGALLCVRALREKVGPDASVTVHCGIGDSRGGVSGGTIASLLAGISEPALRKMGSHSLDPTWKAQGLADRGPQSAPAWNAELGDWTIASVMASINEKVTLRSAALEPAVYGAGGKFDYRECTLTGSRTWAFIGSAVLGLAAGMIAFPPTRALLNATVLPSPGEGPSEKLRETGYFSAHFVAVAEGRSERAYAEVSLRNADPGYKGTALMIAEAALCLALQHAELPELAQAGGCLTPATALGDVLVARLRKAGMQLSARMLQPGEKCPLKVEA
jgi:short subunit dehydrogenase-like uncharacterized protein